MPDVSIARRPWELDIVIMRWLSLWMGHEMDETEQINQCLRTLPDDELEELLAWFEAQPGTPTVERSEEVDSWWESLRWAVVLERIRRVHFSPRVMNPGEVVTTATAMLDADTLGRLLRMHERLDNVLADQAGCPSVRYLAVAFQAVETEWFRRHHA